MMKKAKGRFSLLITLLLLVFLFPITLNASSNVLQLSNTKFGAIRGEEFETTVYVEEGSNVSGLTVILTYDSTLVTLKSWETVDENIVSVEKNNITITYSNSKSVTKQLELITLTFEVDEQIGIGKYDEWLTVTDSSIDIQTKFTPVHIRAKGDAYDDNGNGKINAKDATYILQHIVRMVTMSKEDQYYANVFEDYDADGNPIISAKDVTIILQYIVQMVDDISGRYEVIFYALNENGEYVEYTKKSVKQGEALINIPDGEWSLSSEELIEVDFSKIKSDLKVYKQKHTHTEEIIPAVEATCTTTGLTAGVKCSECNEVLVEQEEIKALGHDYNDATYVWIENNTKVTATKVCKNDASHVVTETVEVVKEQTTDPKCEVAGEYTLTATFTKEGFATQTTTESIPALNHSFTSYVSDNNATCTADGTKTAKCDRCTVTNTITDTGSRLDHDYTNAVYVNNNNDTHSKTCTRNNCGESITETHNYSKDNNLCVCGEHEYLTFTDNGSYYTVKGYKSSSEGKDVVIPSTYNSKPVTVIADNAFKDAKFTSIVIPSSITSVGRGILVGCHTVTSITIPTIGSGTIIPVFTYLYGDTSYPGGNNVDTYIVDSKTWYGEFEDGFGDNFPKNLQTVKVTSTSLTTISEEAFRGCWAKHIIIPSSVTSLGDGAFNRCRNLLSLSGTENIVTLATWVFQDCDSLTSLSFPKATSIGNCAFEFCDVLNTVDVPSLTSTNKLSSQSSLTKLVIGNNSTIDLTKLFPSLTKVTEVVISFKNTTITAPNSITVSSLSSKTITTVTLGDGLTTIPSSLTISCNPTNIKISKSVTTINVDGFKNYSSKTIIYEGTKAEWDKVTLLWGNVTSITVTCSDGTSTKTKPACTESNHLGDTVIDEAVAPTCTTAGKTEGSHCSVCNQSIVKQTTIDALGHSFGDWTIVSQPVGSIPGIKQRTCNRTGCNQVEQEEFTCDHTYDKTTNICTKCGEHEYLIFELNGSNYVVAGYKSNSNVKNIVIPSIYDEIPVTQIKENAFANSDIVSIVIPNSITSIGLGALKKCNSLTSIEIPAFGIDNNKTYIIPYFVYLFGDENPTKDNYVEGYGCFDKSFDCGTDKGCRSCKSNSDGNDFPQNLATVTVTNNPELTKIPDQAFRGCWAKEIILDSSITSIGYASFNRTYNLTSISGPSVKTIGGWAFQNSGLTSVYFEEAETIEGAAFTWCYNLKTVDLPSALYFNEFDGYGAFQGCSSLTTVKIPNAISIVDKTFKECNITSLEINYNLLINESSCIYKGLKNDYIDTFQQISSPFKGLTSLTIMANNNAEINIASFAQLKYICQTISFDPLVYTGITSLVIKGEVSRIYCDEESYINSLTYLKVSSGSIESNAFKYCQSLVEIDLDGVTSIASESFNCRNTLKKLTISTREIPSNAFNGYTKLESVIFKDTVNTIGDSAFNGCTSLTSIDFNNVTIIGAEAFYGCESLTSLDLKNVTLIGSKAFKNCVGLQSITNLKGTIGEQAFYGCSGLNYTVDSGNCLDFTYVTSIGSEAFKECINLQCIKIPNTLSQSNVDISSFTGYIKKIYYNGNSIEEAKATFLSSFVTDHKKGVAIFKPGTKLIINGSEYTFGWTYSGMQFYIS